MILPGIRRKVIRTPHLPTGWEGSILDLIYMESIPFKDRLNIVIDYELISEKLLRIFSIWCARRVLLLCPRKELSELLDKSNEYALGNCPFSDLKEMREAIIANTPEGERPVQIIEAEEAVFSTISVFAKDAASGSSSHSVEVLSYYNDREEIQKKHLWKIRDLVLQYLTSGEVEFILRNDFIPPINSRENNNGRKNN